MPLGLKVSSTFVAITKEVVQFFMLRSHGDWSAARNASVKEPFEEKVPKLDGFV